jgi:y4mF family transcriptional regulator
MTTREIGGKIRESRKRLGLRQSDLAEIAGVTLRGLTDLENGRANPTLKQLSKILEVLGLEVRVVERRLHA